MPTAFAKMSREHGMPMDTSVRERMAASEPARRAVVAARLNAPAAQGALLRAFRVATERHVGFDGVWSAASGT